MGLSDPLRRRGELQNIPAFRRSNPFGGETMTSISPLRTVLAATDFSAGAQQAVARASLLASRQGADLLLVHAVDLGAWFALRDMLDGDRDLHGRVAEQAQMLLGVAADAIRQQGHAGSIRTHVARGRPARALLGAAKEADLVVLGASGEHPVRDVALGSTAEQLSRLVNRPLLLVRRMPAGEYRRVLVPLDFSAPSLRALDVALAIAPTASFHLLHCLELPSLSRMRVAGVAADAVLEYQARARREATRRLDQLVRGLPSGSQVTTTVQVGDVRMELLKQARALDADLIALGKHGQSYLADTFLGSATAATLARAECDVLAVPPAST
jgi:nucleotide-binding universal stress UspA family protein